MKHLKVVLLILALVFATSSTAVADLVVNGGFETGDLTGWTEVGTTPGSWWVIGIPMGAIPHSGTYNATTDSARPTFQYIAQSIATTPGQSYTVEFWLSNTEANNYNEFVARWDGTPMIQLLNLPPDDVGVYTPYSYTAVATGTLATIDFGYRDNPGWYDLDDISVTAVPIPGAIWLLGSGLVGLVAIRRRMRK
jgi:hypothetical protein